MKGLRWVSEDQKRSVVEVVFGYACYEQTKIEGDEIFYRRVFNVGSLKSVDDWLAGKKESEISDRVYFPDDTSQLTESHGK